MSPRWLKVARDLWGERARSLFVVASIAGGLAATTALLASYAILTRELNEQYLATNPASFSIRTDVVDDAVVRAIRANPDVSDAEARRVIEARVRMAGGAWKPLRLFVVDDFARIRVSTLQREKGAWPPSAGQMLVERDAFQVVGAHIGDDLIVKTPGGDPRALRVTGSVHDVGQAQARMENGVYGYVVRDTLPLLGEAPILDSLQVLVARDRFDEARIRRVAAGVKRALESHGHPVRRITVPTPGKHPHAALMGMLLLVLAGFGLFIMVLGSVIVTNLLTVSMAAQVRQIGAMKAIGATTSAVARLYLAEALAYGVASVVVAVPLGLAGSRAVCRTLAVFLNFDMRSFAVPLWVFAVVAALGIVVPLLAAILPVWKGSRVPVRVALSDFGAATPRFGASRLDRMVASIGGFARPFLLSIRNSFRRRFRLAMTVATLAIAGTLFMTAFNVRSSMTATLDGYFASQRHDLIVGLAAPVRWDDALRVMNAIPGVTRAEIASTPHGRFARIVLAKHDVTTIDRVKRELDRRLAAAGFNVAGVTSKRDTRYGFDQHVLMIYVILIVIGVLIGAVGGLGLATTMSLNVVERRGELRILRAIGATPWDIAMTLAGEAAVIAAMSWVAATLAALPLGIAIGRFLTRIVLQSPFEFRFAANGLLFWLGATAIIGVLASVLPAWEASRRPVAAA
ncbi:MAG TPA: FtsX-like permease family protein [Thermoanaerobaculia bacterium]|jgi:putative ABC transport system permease protein